MRKVLLATLQLLLCASLASAQEEFQYEDGVLIATSQNIDKIIAHFNGTFLLELYAPWCGHCKRLQPLYNAAAQKLSAQENPIQLVKGNAADDRSLGMRYGLRSYPTIVFLKNGIVYKYTGARTEEGIIAWLSQRTHPTAELITCTQLAHKVKANQLNLVLFAEESSTQRDTLVKLAQDHSFYDKYGFYQVSEPDCAVQHQIGSTPAFAIFRNFDEPIVNYSGDISEQNLKSFIIKQSIPSLFYVKDGDDVRNILELGHKVAIMFSENRDSSNTLYQAFRAASQTYRGKMLFAISGMQDGAQDKIRGHFGLHNTQYPIIGIIDQDPNLKYILNVDEETTSEEQINGFINDFFGDKLSKYIKSEDIPDESSHDDVFTKVVSKTFEQEVLKSQSNVVVVYTTRRCQNCPKIQQMIRSLAPKLRQQNSNLKFVVFDDYYNEHEGRNIKGHPELRIYAENKPQSVEYSDKMDEQKLSKWILDNAKLALPVENVPIEEVKQEQAPEEVKQEQAPEEVKQEQAPEEVKQEQAPEVVKPEAEVKKEEL
ncbi:disulfide isomerase [Stylonychia lemnae]|uniref:Disulfide isomerase n=1 Tax=Stylonychia lemnae TaxID=5949 RepID=A0A077ZWN7_STYLE|nr:disulfide isomerase [Stylonychia lemnae]|eukprot:CDW74310.1 disulfide isomerase [Stylonychia lemnae]